MINTLDEALALYLGSENVATHPDFRRGDLIDAAKAAAQWRIDGPRATALVLQALHEDGMTFRQIEEKVNIDHVTVQRLINRLREGVL